MKTVSIQIPADVPLHGLASDAADLSVSTETCRSAIFALSEMVRKSEKDLSAKAVHGVADTLEMIHRNLVLADDEAKNLAERLQYALSEDPPEDPQDKKILPYA